MKLASLVPDFLKPILRPIYRKMTHRPKSRSTIHSYWRQPWDGSNLPQGYLEGKEKSEFLLRLLEKHADRQSKILEVGCNVGRNLNELFLAGFRNLEGIEISETAVELLRHSYPEMGRSTRIHNIAVEDVVKEFEDGQFDVVFTMAVLEHIHKDSEWVFAEMARITKSLLVTIEDERGLSWRHFPRNYRKVFERLGMKQTAEFQCDGIEGLGVGFCARIFEKEHEGSRLRLGE